jgi:hypothetical protein
MYLLTTGFSSGGVGSETGSGSAEGVAVGAGAVVDIG